jgi:hypothetical protein
MHMARLAGLDRDDTPVVLVAKGYSEACVQRGLGFRIRVGEETHLVLDGVNHATNLFRCDRASRVASGEDAFRCGSFALNVADPSGDDGRVRVREDSRRPVVPAHLHCVALGDVIDVEQDFVPPCAIYELMGVLNGT